MEELKTVRNRQTSRLSPGRIPEIVKAPATTRCRRRRRDLVQREKAGGIENVVHDDAELVELIWVPIAEAQNMDLAMITHIVLDELQERIKADLRRDLPAPFYQMQGSHFERELL